MNECANADPETRYLFVIELPAGSHAWSSRGEKNSRLVKGAYFSRLLYPLPSQERTRWLAMIVFTRGQFPPQVVPETPTSSPYRDAALGCARTIFPLVVERIGLQPSINAAAGYRTPHATDFLFLLRTEGQISPLAWRRPLGGKRLLIAAQLIPVVAMQSSFAIRRALPPQRD